jgi:probable addiction module antidote protein
MTRISEFDPAEYLGTPENIAIFLRDAFATSDAAVIADALGVVARAQGMSSVAERTGLTRPSLYKSLSADGQPQLDTILRVLKAAGLELVPKPIRDTAA